MSAAWAGIVHGNQWLSEKWHSRGAIPAQFRHVSDNSALKNGPQVTSLNVKKPQSPHPEAHPNDRSRRESPPWPHQRTCPHFRRHPDGAGLWPRYRGPSLRPDRLRVEPREAWRAVIRPQVVPGKGARPGTRPFLFEIRLLAPPSRRPWRPAPRAFGRVGFPSGPRMARVGFPSRQMSGRDRWRNTPSTPCGTRAEERGSGTGPAPGNAEEDERAAQQGGRARQRDIGRARGDLDAADGAAEGAEDRVAEDRAGAGEARLQGDLELHAAVVEDEAVAGAGAEEVEEEPAGGLRRREPERGRPADGAHPDPEIGQGERRAGRAGQAARGHGIGAPGRAPGERLEDRVRPRPGGGREGALEMQHLHRRRPKGQGHGEEEKDDGEKGRVTRKPGHRHDTPHASRSRAMRVTPTKDSCKG